MITTNQQFISSFPIIRKLCSDVCPAAERVKGEAPLIMVKTLTVVEKPNDAWWYQTRNANMDQLNTNQKTSNLALRLKTSDLVSGEENHMSSDRTLKTSYVNDTLDQAVSRMRHDVKNEIHKYIQDNFKSKRAQNYGKQLTNVTNAKRRIYEQYYDLLRDQVPLATQNYLDRSIRESFLYITSRPERYPSRGTDFYKQSSLYTPNGNIHTDRRLTMIPRMKTTQGLGITLTYLAEAATAVSSAFSYYLMYKTGKNVFTTAREAMNFAPPQEMITTIKNYIMEIICLLNIAYRIYIGTLSYQDGLLMLGGLSAWVVGKKHLLSVLLTTLKPVPAHSTRRETQGFEPTTIAQSIIALLTVLGLGTSGGVDAKSVYSSIKGLGSTILAVKTVEQVFIAIINFLPDILQAIIAENIPSFGLYLKLSGDPIFKNFITKTHELQDIGESELFYNSHNFSSFLKFHTFIKNYITESENRKAKVDLLIPKIIDWYDAMYTKADNLGLLPGKRNLPYVIWISGDPGIGKSTMVYSIASTLLKELLPEDMEVSSEEINKYIFSHNTSNKYFDGYNNQPIFILNDYLQFSQENEEQWLIRFSDTIDCPLEVSSVDNIDTGVKGEVRFTSRVIIITSNVTYLNNSATVTNLEAFNRRRDMVIDMRWKPVPYKPPQERGPNERKDRIDFNNFNYDWADIRQLPPTTIPGMQRYYEDIEDIDDLFDRIMNMHRSFCLRSYQMKLPKINKEKSTIKKTLDLLNEGEKRIDNVINSTWKVVTSYFDKEIFGIKFKYLLPLVVGGSSAMYVMYKTWVPTFIEKFSHSLSGDSGTKKLQKVLRPLKRTTMGTQKNNLEMINRMMSNTVSISTTMKSPDGHILKQTMWGWSLGGSLILTPKHLWRRGNLNAQVGDKVTIIRSNIQHDMYVEENNLFLFEEEDLAVFNTMTSMPYFKNLSNMLLGEDYMVREDGEDCIVVVPTEDHCTLIPVNAFITDAPYMDEFGGKYEGRSIWQYNHKLVKGDCGSLLVLSTKGGMNIAGIHVAGDSYSGNAEVLTTSTYNKAVEYFNKKTQGFCTNVELTEDEFFDAESDLEGNFYYLGAVKNPPYQNSRTQIQKSPLYEILQEHLTEPAVLSPSDSRMIVPVSPILKSVAKYGVPVIPFSRELMEEAFHIVRTMYDPIKGSKLRVGTHKESINATFTPNLEKLDLSTSAGYPWNTKGKKKLDLITNTDGELNIKQELQDVINKCENCLSNNTMFPYTIVTTLKDERVSIEKVAIGKTRTFMNFPVEYTILLRKYFDDFIDKETKHAFEIGTTVGVNIYSTRWNTLFQTLNGFDCTTDGDFKAFDGTIRPEFFRYYSRLVNSFYKDEFTKQRDMLVTGCCFAPIFVLNKVYVKLQGNPSGSRLTTSFNSFVNRMYVIMSMLHALPESLHRPDFIRRNVKIFAHGDDHIIGFNHEVREYWNALYLKEFMLSHGIDYTSSTKDAELGPERNLFDCYYLKSYFVYDRESGTYRAGLDKTVIQEMVSWQRDDDIKSTDMIVNTALRYAYFWGFDYFNHIYKKLEDEIIRRKLNINLIDFISLDIEYRSDGELEFTYN
jgi:hypothetical protein